MADEALLRAGLHFDELNKIRVLEPEVQAQTSELKEECKDFVDSECLWTVHTFNILVIKIIAKRRILLGLYHRNPVNIYVFQTQYDYCNHFWIKILGSYVIIGYSIHQCVHIIYKGIFSEPVASVVQRHGTWPHILCLVLVMFQCLPLMSYPLQGYRPGECVISKWLDTYFWLITSLPT